MNSFLKLPILTLVVLFFFTGCSAPISKSNNASKKSGHATEDATARNSSKSSSNEGNETSTSPSLSANPSLVSLFNKKVDPDGYSKGIIQSSTLWKAKQDVDLFAMKDNGRLEMSDQAVQTISKGKEFRVCTLMAAPFMDQQSTKIYGQMADGSGWALLYDHSAANPQMADLEENSAWDLKIPVQLKPDTTLYAEKDGISPIGGNAGQLLNHLETGKDNTIWAQTSDGWFQLFDENGPEFFTSVNGFSIGPLSGNGSLQDVYRQIILSKSLKNLTGGLNWGYALADLNRDQVPELLIANGGLNKDQKIEVYGLNSKVLEGKDDGSFSIADSLLYEKQDSSNEEDEVLVFQTLEDEYRILKIGAADGNVQTTELANSEISKLNADTLKEIKFTSINDLTAVDQLKSAPLSTLYPDYKFFIENNAGSGSDESNSNTSLDSTWQLNYNMTVREGPDRSSAKHYVLPKGMLIHTVQERMTGAETWGELETGGWVCLQDAEYQYASPAVSNAEQNSSADWYTVYSQLLQSEAADPRYGSSIDYHPSWYLWNHPDYTDLLLVMKTGTCEADFQLKFYALINGTPQEIGSTSAGHSSFFTAPDPRSFYQLHAHMGMESLDLLTLSQDGLASNNISSRENVLEYQTPDGEYWNFQPISAW